MFQFREACIKSGMRRLISIEHQILNLLNCENVEHLLPLKTLSRYAINIFEGSHIGCSLISSAWQSHDFFIYQIKLKRQMSSEGPFLSTKPVQQYLNSFINAITLLYQYLILKKGQWNNVIMSFWYDFACWQWLMISQMLQKDPNPWILDKLIHSFYRNQSFNLSCYLISYIGIFPNISHSKNFISLLK